MTTEINDPSYWKKKYWLVIVYTAAIISLLWALSAYFERFARQG